MQIIVLGPHRSGTSLVTRLINLMGAYVGDESDSLGAAEDNPKGFWERRDVVDTNNAILAHFGCAWNDLAGWQFDHRTAELPEELTAQIASAVSRLDARQPWVVKDPRLCLTLPYWLPFLSQPVGVIVSRDPAEVAVSLTNRDRIALGHAMAVWEYSAVGILTHATHLPVVRVAYDAVVEAPVETAARLYLELAHLGGKGLHLPARSDVEEFVDRKLYRSRPSLEVRRGLVTPHQAGLATALGEPIPADARYEVSALSATAMEAYREVVAIRSWAKGLEAQAHADRELAASERARADTVSAARQSERDAVIGELVTLRRSWSWRFTSPFRFVRYLVTGDLTKVRYILDLMGQRAYSRLPVSLQGIGERTKARALTVTGILPHSTANMEALSAIVDERCRLTATDLACDPLTAALPAEPPAVDISAVTFNSRKWIDGFVESLLNLQYPRHKLTLRFVDNSSTDDTLEVVRAAAARRTEAGVLTEVLVRPNRGFGAGHNAGIAAGSAPFCLVTNVDLQFEPDALARAVGSACADPAAAAWEFRQKPYEHPKFYDPVTGTTNWNAHACVLLRRSAFEKVRGYDESLFMYGEDVELSYRLRRAGFRLRYCPAAGVFQYSYESPDQIKPTQYTGSTFANLYIRLKFGTPADVFAVPLLATRLLLTPQVFPGSRREVVRHVRRLAGVSPKAVALRRRSPARFPFRVWDYELTREGAFVPTGPLPVDQPLVSVVTRTYRGRSQLLRQCLLSVAHQTYPNIEHIVVEDGGSTARELVDAMGVATGRPARFIPLDKVGRSAAGNRGLLEAQGRWCLFLDDDDLLFADHVELLAATLLSQPDAVAAYSLPWEVTTDDRAGGYVETSYAVPPILRQDFDYAVLRHHNYMAIQSVLFECRLFVERGGFDEDMQVLEDWMLWLRYAYGNRFAYVPKVTSLFRTPAQPSKVDERLDAFNMAYPLAVARVEEHIRTIEAGTAR